MVQKNFSDFCGIELREITHNIEVYIEGKELDICDSCAEKIAEFLKSIKKSS